MLFSGGVFRGVFLMGVVNALNELGLRPDLTEVLQQPFGPGGVFFGLGLAGLGGLVAAVAMSVPGRESLARAGLLTSLFGMAVAAGLGTLLILRSPLIEAGTSLGTDLNCLTIACAVALLPSLGIMAFAGRAAPLRPLVLVLAAAAGTAALGAVTAQASCPSLDPGHLMLGHILAPAVGALVLAVPLLVALRRQPQG